MRRIYLDNNSTTPIDPLVSQAMHEAQEQFPANPSSQHAEGRQAKARLRDACDAILRQVGGDPGSHPPDRLILTSGGTESNNLAMRGWIPTSRARVIVSVVEHPSVLQVALLLQAGGCEIAFAPVDSRGIVDLAELANLLEFPTQLVSVQWANHETGIIQPVSEISRLCRARNALFHSDAVQAVGKVPVRFREAGIDALTLAPHKFHGPRGVGCLLIRAG
ncbi:MAG TPA: aminotransferase class V-fold PLP-dependent enzyme, partial [Pirellulaceae bacterium]